jgi:hypothetical protein
VYSFLAHRGGAQLDKPRAENSRPFIKPLKRRLVKYEMSLLTRHDDVIGPPSLPIVLSNQRGEQKTPPIDPGVASMIRKGVSQIAKEHLFSDSNKSKTQQNIEKTPQKVIFTTKRWSPPGNPYS